MTKKELFFIGYLPVPQKFWLLLIMTFLVFFAAFIFSAWAVGLSQNDPGNGRFRFDLGRQTVSGILETRPYPMIHVTEGSSAIDAGETLMLSGAGKFGVEPHASNLNSTSISVTGVILNRGTLRMLQVPNPRRNLSVVESEQSVSDPIDLGRWRLVGEICDGKCYAGAMRPGRGIAHKACAELCIEGGLPPVFVTTEPVEMHEYLLIGGADGGPISDQLLEKVGVYVSLEGHIELRGSIAVFLADEDSLEVLP